MQLAEKAWGGYAEDTSEVCAPTLAHEISPPDRRISWSRNAWIRTVTGGAPYRIASAYRLGGSIPQDSQSAGGFGWTLCGPPLKRNSFVAINKGMIASDTFGIACRALKVIHVSIGVKVLRQDKG